MSLSFLVDSLFSLNLVMLLSVSFLLFGFFTIASSKWTAVTKITRIPTSQLVSTSPQILITTVTSFKSLTSTVSCIKSSSVICPKRKRRSYIEPVRNIVESERIDPSTIHWIETTPIPKDATDLSWTEPDSDETGIFANPEKINSLESSLSHWTNRLGRRLISSDTIDIISTLWVTTWTVTTSKLEFDCSLNRAFLQCPDEDPSLSS